MAIAMSAPVSDLLMATLAATSSSSGPRCSVRRWITDSTPSPGSALAIALWCSRELPEHEMGERVAHLVTGRMLDFIEFEDDYAMVKTHAPEEAVGMPLDQSRLRSKYGVTVVSVKRQGEGFTYAAADTVINPGDVLILAGRTSEVERVADLT